MGRRHSAGRRGEPATGQMKEFAGRTHQPARHDLAGDYAPPDIQAAAMPIRVEKRRAQTGSITASSASSGAASRPADRLAIRSAPTTRGGLSRCLPPPQTHPRVDALGVSMEPPAAGDYRSRSEFLIRAVPSDDWTAATTSVRSASRSADAGAAELRPLRRSLPARRVFVLGSAPLSNIRGISKKPAQFENAGACRAPTRIFFQWSVKHGHTFGV